MTEIKCINTLLSECQICQNEFLEFEQRNIPVLVADKFTVSISLTFLFTKWIDSLFNSSPDFSHPTNIKHIMNMFVTPLV